jgi:hypothetical protein
MPFEKGKSGNPKGRPKKEVCFTQLIREEANKFASSDDNKNKKRHRELIIGKLYELAEAGDLAAIKYLMDRTDGSPRQSVNTHQSDVPVGFEIGFEDAEDTDTTTE